eukprot:m.152041 g.152041  ORF g.152041 m.152041 type:complete len:242 (+) comp15101_c3_seq1:283-1008(+)
MLSSSHSTTTMAATNFQAFHFFDSPQATAAPVPASTPSSAHVRHIPAYISKAGAPVAPIVPASVASFLPPAPTPAVAASAVAAASAAPAGLIPWTDSPHQTATPATPARIIDKRSASRHGSKGSPEELSRSAPSTPEPHKLPRTNHGARSASKATLPMLPFEFGGGLPKPERHSVPHLSFSDMPSLRESSPPLPAPVRTQPASPSAQRFAEKGRPQGSMLPNPMTHSASVSLIVNTENTTQ